MLVVRQLFTATFKVRFSHTVANYLMGGTVLPSHFSVRVRMLSSAADDRFVPRLSNNLLDTQSLTPGFLLRCRFSIVVEQ
jgi:hypothetical protein